VHRGRLWLAVAALVSAFWWAAVTADLTVVDDSGRGVRLEQPARRIVTLSPHAAELVFDAGAGDRLAGATAFSDYPPEARAIPRIGDAARLDRERLLVLDPDLIIAWPSGNRPQDLSWLQGRSIPLYYSEPASLEAIADNLHDIGLLAGTETSARRAAQGYLARLRALRLRYRRETPLRVFYQVWHHPLITVGTGHFITRVLTLCGATSLFPGLETAAPKVSREAVIQADPDAIVAAHPVASDRDPFAAWRRWPGMKAVREGRLIPVPAELIHRPVPAVLDGAEIICRGLEQGGGEALAKERGRSHETVPDN
jgi:iron complex transport system substrate-binding protein